MLRRAVVTSALAGLGWTIATAQSQTVPAQKPDFSGSWVIDLSVTDLPQSPNDYGFGASLAAAVVAGTQLTITQDRQNLKINRMIGTTPVLFTIKLDGTETQHKVPALGGPLVESSRAEWQADRLMITTVIVSDPKRTTAVQVLTRKGNALLVEYQRKLSNEQVVRRRIGYRDIHYGFR
jgi:hypothetical protein